MVCMTDDGRPEAFIKAIENFKNLGVNIVFHKTLGLKNVILNKEVVELSKEKELWAQVLKEENLSVDIVITHNSKGEYGHGAHKLLSAVAESLFDNIWKFVLPIVEQPIGKKIFKTKLENKILEHKTSIFIKNYPTEQYIWQALKPLMDYEFKVGIEIFTSD